MEVTINLQETGRNLSPTVLKLKLNLLFLFNHTSINFKEISLFTSSGHSSVAFVKTS